MMHLITGGSGSGKSAYAESCVLAAGSGRRIYIATMIPYGEEGRQRVERHRALRKEKKFETMECYTDIGKLQLQDHNSTEQQPCQTVILLECMSNLIANEIFEPDGAGEAVVEAVCDGIRQLHSQADHLVIVTNEVFSDGITYDEQTMHYLACLGEVNRRLAEMADEVTEVVYGIPVKIKMISERSCVETKKDPVRE
jgi:adenosylcobinamide kinase/adenosylcobinamide-phosphate guanylyltransferase